MNNKVLKVIKIVIVNIFTTIRLIGAFLLPYIYYKYGANVTAGVVIPLFLTDAIDGFLARTWEVTTFWGCMTDAISDKLLNAIAFIILGFEYNIMFAPLVVEIAILYTCYSTYRYGGNVKSTGIGKLKTVILDILVIACFVLMALPLLHLNNLLINFLINKSVYLIYVFGIIILIFALVTLFDYMEKNKFARKNPQCMKIKHTKKKKKSFGTIMKLFFDTEYYQNHKDESIMKQLFVSNK